MVEQQPYKLRVTGSIPVRPIPLTYHKQKRKIGERNMDNEIFKEIANKFREVAELFDAMVKCEDEETLEEYQLKYIAKMLKINKLADKLQGNKNE